MVVVSVFVTVVFSFDILPWLLIEGFLAARCAEVVSLALKFRFASGSLGVNLHATNGVFYHVFSPLLKTGFSYVTSLRPRDTGKQRHLSYFSVGNSACFAGNAAPKKNKKHPMAYIE
jgi:hypothetical protein